MVERRGENVGEKRMNNFTPCTHHTYTHTYTNTKKSIWFIGELISCSVRGNGTQDDIIRPVKLCLCMCKSEPEKKNTKKNWKKKTSGAKKYRQIIFKVLFIFAIQRYVFCALKENEWNRLSVYNNSYWWCHLDNSLRHHRFSSLAVPSYFMQLVASFHSFVIYILFFFFFFSIFHFHKDADCFYSMSCGVKAIVRMYTGRFKSQKIVCSSRQKCAFSGKKGINLPISIKFI